MNENPLLHRLWAGFIGLNAGFVAYLGLAKPRFLDEKFNWAEIPPLHARFIGGLYLFGAVFLLGSVLCRRWAQVAPLMVATTIFTSSMILLTVLNWEAFDLDLAPAVVWVAAYCLFPPGSLALAIRYRKRSAPEPAGSPLPARLPAVLRSVAALFGVVGLGLLVARSTVAGWWPWPVSNGVAQFYGGPFLTLAWCAWAYSGRRTIESLRLYLAAMAALGTSVTVVSIHHRSLFDGGDPATWLWFATFAFVGIGSVAVLARSFGASLTPAGSGSPKPVAG